MQVMRTVNRRGVVALAGLLIGALAGCAGGGNGTGNTSSNSGSNGGGGGTSGSDGTFTATFSRVSGTNADTSEYKNPNYARAVIGTGAYKVLNISSAKVVNTTNSRSFLIALIGSDFTAGQTFSLDPTSPDYASFSYNESAGTTAKVWTPTGGSLVIDSISGKTYSVHFTNVTLTSGEDNNSGATGSFTVNGTAKVSVP